MSKFPIVASNSKWTSQEKCLIRSYKFDNKKTSEYFIFEILKFLRETVSDIEFRKRGDSIVFIIRALSPYISEIELEAAKEIDIIYEDVKFYKRK